MNFTNTINININGTHYNMSKDTSLAEAITILETTQPHPKENRYVIAVNQTFIPKSQYLNTLLQENDDIEFLTPMAGG